MSGYTEIALLQYELAKLHTRVAELEERRCEVCGYAEHHREHIGCLRKQVSRLKAELREICAAIDDPACDLTLTTVECIKKLKAENESLRKDAARLDWVEHQDFYDLSFSMLVNQPNDGMTAVSIGEGWHLGNNLREAIDAAMIAGDKNVLD